MIADKRSIAINPLATDPADLESEIFHFSTIFSFSVIYFSTPRGGMPELQNPSHFTSINLGGPGGI